MNDRGGIPARAPVLLPDADYYGTLAVTRALGARGVPVHVASDRWLGTACWSRYAARALTSPPLMDSERFLDWLCAFGAAEPGTILYPTSDDAAYLYASRLDELSRTFAMYQPGVDAVLRVLDKKKLYDGARAVGLATPETWVPETEAEVERIARDAPFPLLIKSRTQVLSRTHTKGIIVHERAELLARYRAFVGCTRFGDALLARLPDAPRAMIQTYLPDAATQIYMLACFVDRTHTQFAARASMKILQRPRSLGIGICFEDAPLEADLVDSVRRLAREAGYFGVFSVEFIKTGGRYLLIDFNPRFYNQLAFEIARGFPVPEIVYAAASGATGDVRRLVSDAQARTGEGLVFCNTFGMDLMLWVQRLSGRASADDRRRWQAWRDDHRGAIVDATRTPGDTAPMLVDAAIQLLDVARHPRAFVRGIMLDRATF